MQLPWEELFYYTCSKHTCFSLLWLQLGHLSASARGRWPWRCVVWGCACSHWPRGSQAGAHQPPSLSVPGFPCSGTSARGLYKICHVLWHQMRHKCHVWSTSMALLPALSLLCFRNRSEGIKFSELGLNFWSNTSFFVSLVISLTERCWKCWKGLGRDNSVHMSFAQSTKGKNSLVLAFLENNSFIRVWTQMIFWSLEHTRLLLLVFFVGCGPLEAFWYQELVPWWCCRFYLLSAPLQWICRDFENYPLGLIWGAWWQNRFLPFYNFLLIIPLVEVGETTKNEASHVYFLFPLMAHSALSVHTQPLRWPITTLKVTIIIQAAA